MLVDERNNNNKIDERVFHCIMWWYCHWSNLLLLLFQYSFLTIKWWKEIVMKNFIIKEEMMVNKCHDIHVFFFADIPSPALRWMKLKKFSLFLSYFIHHSWYRFFLIDYWSILLPRSMSVKEIFIKKSTCNSKRRKFDLCMDIKTV